MSTRVTSPVQLLVIKARGKLGFTQREMAEAVGSSERSVARWEGNEASPYADHLYELAALLYPLDAALAEQAAKAGGKTLEQLGIVAPPPAPAPPAPEPEALAAPPSPASPPLPVHLLADSVVYAAAQAVEETPVSLRVARAMVAAAFARARDLRLECAEVAEALAPVTGAAPGTAPAPAPASASASAPAPAPAPAPASASAFEDRRARSDRRGADDRRVFPPRPEGRRRGGGRRPDDPEDA
jgi:transcriptional regulator with XRE-family HTH domain